MKHLLKKISDVNIVVKDDVITLLTATEINKFVKSIYGKEFVNRSQATKLTGLSYVGSVNSSSKIEKGAKYNYNTYVIYLNPYKNLFGNVCPKALTCVDACLNTSGRVKLDLKEFKILKARYLKTILFYINRDFFNAWVFAEIESHKNRLENFMVRLNGTSDLSPKLFKYNNEYILDKFNDVTFYDYTKIKKRIETNQNKNYHLTFSYDGLNLDECLEVQEKYGVNVSIVVDGAMPKTFKGKEVFDMDVTDLRPLDTHKGAFGYLKLKETLNKEYDKRFVLEIN